MNQVAIKTHYSAAELAAMRLPSLPTTKGKILAKAEREGWNFVEVTGIGGIRRVYAPPAETLAVIKDRVVESMIHTAPQGDERVSNNTQVIVSGACAGSLKDWQKHTAEARAAILREVDRIAELVGREKAIMKVVIMAQDGTLPEHLAPLVPVANAKSGKGGKRTLSRRTIHRWFADATKGADGRIEVNALAPKDQFAVTRIPEWASDLLAIYQSPQGRSLAYAVEQVAPQFGLDEAVLYHRARRFIAKMGAVELQTGRMGPRALKNIKPFVRRDSTGLWPADVYTADGHTFDAEVAHPAHGRPFRPEITGVIDVNTRRYVGWSVDLAESGLAVLDALRHACETGGIPAIFYVDNGSGYRNALMSAPGVGMETRLGFTISHSLPYNSQARGIIERSHKTLWVRAAKELPTYIGQTMDAEAKNKVHKLTRRDIAIAGCSKYLMPFNDFIQFCNAKVDAYNSRPHRSLPMVYDQQLGRQRHMSPNEAWQKGIEEGAKLVTITEQEARDLFRPQREVKVSRGEVRLFGNRYFSLDLTEYHGEIVRAAYDVHNGDRVWIYDQAGRYVCVAEFEANSTKYMPDSALDKAAERRAKARKGRLLNKLDEVDAELNGVPAALENNPSPTLSIVPNLLQREAELVELLEAESPQQLAQQSRPVFLVESDRYEWLMEHRGEWNELDRQFLQRFVNSDIYQSLSERFEVLGLAWDGGEGSLAKAG